MQTTPRRPSLRLIGVAFLTTLLLSGCGSGGGGGTQTATFTNSGSTNTGTTPTGGQTTAVAVGNVACLECHASTTSNQVNITQAADLTPTSPTFFANFGIGIGAAYHAGVHSSPDSSGNQTDTVQCEQCHGNGSMHNGIGPIPFYEPGVLRCAQCHDSNGFIANFVATGHGNSNPPTTGPDKFFFQSSFGTQQEQFGVFLNGSFQDFPGFFADGVTPVTANEHIQQCSNCHSYGSKIAHVSIGDVPDPPQVSCGSCHDAHQPVDELALRNTLAPLPQASFAPSATPRTVVPPQAVINFKPQQVNNDPTQPQFAAKNVVSGTWIRPRWHYPYMAGGLLANTFTGYLQQFSRSGDILRLSDERECASCHSVGKYQFTAIADGMDVSNTHQDDVYTQYLTSGHANKTDTPFVTFSLLAAVGSSHRPLYPQDMGHTDPRINGGANNYTCYQCHNGLGTIDYQNAVQGGLDFGDSQNAHILWGDETVTCLSCHDPHQNGASTTNNVRQPVLLSYNSEFTVANPNNVRGGVYKMMDLTTVPNMGNSIVCLFCHQGRESGWTNWHHIQEDGSPANGPNFSYVNISPTQSGQPVTPATIQPGTPLVPNTTTIPGYKSLNQPHYLAGGALLFSKNLWEFILGATTANPTGTPQQYSNGIPQHQGSGTALDGTTVVTTDCTGCHMSSTQVASVGGHSWNPDIATCQKCHNNAIGNPVISFHDVPASLDYAGLGTTFVVPGTASAHTDFDEIGTLTVIDNTQTFTHGANKLFGSGQGGHGLFGLLNEALWDAGMFYDPTTNPYFYKSGTATAGNKDGTSFTTYTTPIAAAAYNLADMYKTGSVDPTTGLSRDQAVYVHNPFYSAQILIDSLFVLGKITNGTTGLPFNRPTTPAGGTLRPATDYRTLSP